MYNYVLLMYVALTMLKIRYALFAEENFLYPQSNLLQKTEKNLFFKLFISNIFCKKFIPFG